MINDGTAKWEMNKVASEAQLEDVEKKANEVSKITSIPAWWLDRGDGSDGDFKPTANTTISGLKQYRSVFIPEGVTVTIKTYAVIKCQAVFSNNGIITAVGQGASGGYGGYYSGSSSTGGHVTNAAGGGVSGTSSIGGAGGTNHGANGAGGGLSAFNVPLDASSSISLIMTLHGFGVGSGGGGGACGSSKYDRYGGASGGSGGGAISVRAKGIHNSGIITANGSNGGSTGNNHGSGGGGGGGGAIVLIAESVSNSGSITAAGGIGGGGRTSGAVGGTGVTFIKELGVM